MTRFQIITILALPLAALALGFGNLALLIGVLVAFGLIIGLGVTLPQLSLFGPYVCRGNPAGRCVALTFDDGPDGRSTPALLELLRAEGVAAAFFCIGERVAANHELAARIVREGHLLENHSYAHSNATNLFTVARLKAELTRTQAAIQQSTGMAPQYFRPPMGLSNPRVFRCARALGLQVIGWSARGLDTQSHDPERIVARIVRQLDSGAIILLHDGNIPAERLVVTVKLLLAKLKERRYEIVRLDKMLK
ncbi:MAG: polysaccharide deacetylase family protein [Verrucomicrobia subdivision 3 bacterium]|nr:polysaccharide deacetylase family protein [Verrucomicrobiota bacterium]MCC6823831.1 polysaccharide deacetylase family protein [Limisphaerales bacterium]